MNPVDMRKPFKAGSDVAVRVPKSWGLEPGDDVEIARTAPGIMIRKKAAPASAPHD